MLLYEIRQFFTSLKRYKKVCYRSGRSKIQVTYSIEGSSQRRKFRGRFSYLRHPKSYAISFKALMEVMIGFKQQVENINQRGHYWRTSYTAAGKNSYNGPELILHSGDD
jgi:hypothetical protein